MVNVTRRALTILAIAMFLAAGLLAVAVVRAQGPIGPDAAWSAAVHDFVGDNRWLVRVGMFYDLAGSVFVLLPVTVGVVVWLARSGRTWWAWWVGVAGMGGWMISQTVKRLVDRERPVWADPFAIETSPSFPSGHAMAGIYGWFAFGVVAWSLGHRRLGVVLMVFGVTMGPSRVLLGVHWPTDVLGGWLLAGGWLCAVAAVLMSPRIVASVTKVSKNPVDDEHLRHTGGSGTAEIR